MGLLDKLFSRKISKDAFAKIVLDPLAAKGISNTTYHPDQFSITIGKDSNTIFLHNTYVNYIDADKTRRTMLIEHLTGSFATKTDIPHSYSAAAPNLMPIVRAPSYFSLVALDFQARSANAKLSGLDCPTKPICDGLVAMLAHDTEHSIMQVNRESFDRWGVTLDAALSAAIDHLRDKTDTRLLREVFPGLYQGQWGDSYATARILLTDLIYRVSVEGDPIAFLPSCDNLWVTGSLNLNGLRKLLELADQLHFAGHPLSPNFYLLNNGTWSPYLPDDPALRDLSLKLIRKREAVDYNQQTEALNKIHARDKIDLFVAKYMVFRRKDGTEYSTAVWSNGIDSLLPKADTFTFGIDPPKKQFLTVPWHLAYPIVSNLLEEQPGLLPVRYRPRTFPDEQQRAALRTHAIQLNEN